ncbi:hypothetical protein GGR50DRAFT_692696 [Xylaria sp. CBS 124048]|nr:hypothetical protein GGR50DRAFT_692696 [Xylaria sp. CBS 124048]
MPVVPPRYGNDMPLTTGPRQPAGGLAPALPIYPARGGSGLGVMQIAQAIVDEMAAAERDDGDGDEDVPAAANGGDGTAEPAAPAKRKRGRPRKSEAEKAPKKPRPSRSAAAVAARRAAKEAEQAEQAAAAGTVDPTPEVPEVPQVLEEPAWVAQPPVTPPSQLAYGLVEPPAAAPRLAIEAPVPDGYRQTIERWNQMLEEFQTPPVHSDEQDPVPEFNPYDNPNSVYPPLD